MKVYWFTGGGEGAKPPSASTAEKRVHPHHPGSARVWTVSCGSTTYHEGKRLPAQEPAITFPVVETAMTTSISNGTTYRLYVGIDIAAKTFTASWMTPEGRPSPALSFEQSPAGFAALQEHLQTTGVAPPRPWSCWKPPVATGSPWP